MANPVAHLDMGDKQDVQRVHNDAPLSRDMLLRVQITIHYRAYSLEVQHDN